jgi:hypothetical protein
MKEPQRLAMINIKNIKNAEIRTDPWEHLVIENILDLDIFKKLVEEFKKLTPKLIDVKRNKDGWWPNELADMGVDQEIIDILMNINRQILQNSDVVLEKFSNSNRSEIGYYSVPRFNFTPPFDRGQIHDDGDVDDKSMIMVIYLFPDEACGTCLYKNGDVNSFVTEIPWTPNSSMIFVPKQGVSWHDFQAKDLERLTLNFYYEKLEYSNVVQSFSFEKMSWFYEAMSSDNFMIEFKK